MADETRMVLAAREEYGSTQMRDDLILLRKFQEQYPTNFTEKLIEGRKSIPEVIEVDNARRRVKTHYLKPVWLHRNKHISDTAFYNMTDSWGIELFQTIVRPMSIAIDNKHNPEIADFDHLASHLRNLKWYRL